jgi:hypothetical protein
MSERIPARLTPAEGRKFALTVGAALLGLGTVAWYRGHAGPAGMLGGVALALVLAGLTVPGRLGPVWRSWMGIARAISRVTTPVFMGMVYFVVFTPLGLLKKLAGHNALIHSAGTDGYWVRRAEPDRRSNLERQF